MKNVLCLKHQPVLAKAQIQRSIISPYSSYLAIPLLLSRAE